jgi:hypothetical protein
MSCWQTCRPSNKCVRVCCVLCVFVCVLCLWICARYCLVADALPHTHTHTHTQFPIQCPWPHGCHITRVTRTRRRYIKQRCVRARCVVCVFVCVICVDNMHTRHKCVCVCVCAGIARIIGVKREMEQQMLLDQLYVCVCVCVFALVSRCTCPLPLV